ADIARELGGNIDPDAILAARDALVLALGHSNAAAFASLYDRLADDGPFSPDAGSAGRRALRNVLLDYLSAGSGDPARAASQFRDATSMTDRAAALTVLATRHGGRAEAGDALRAFEERFRSDPLVMDK